MEKFARIIELEDSQVLYRYEYSIDQDEYILYVSTMFNGFMAEMKASFLKETEALLKIENFTEADARKFRKTILKAFVNEE